MSLFLQHGSIWVARKIVRTLPCFSTILIKNDNFCDFLLLPCMTKSFQIRAPQSEQYKLILALLSTFGQIYGPDKQPHTEINVPTRKLCKNNQRTKVRGSTILKEKILSFKSRLQFTELPDPEMQTGITVQILCIGTDRSQQTVQTKIRLLLKKQSDQGLRCLPFHQHLLDALMQCYIKLFYF